MPPTLNLAVPEDAATSTFTYTVPFFDTDAMGIVHHANYVRYLELARVQFLADHDRPYDEYIAGGRHVAVIGVETRYHQACRFDETLHITCWLRWVRAASLGFGYVIDKAGQKVVSATTDHAVVTLEGRPTRMPADVRSRLSSRVVT